MSDCLLTTTLLTKKKEIDNVIRDTIDKVLVLRFGRASDPVCLHLDDILSKSAREVSKFSTIALVDIDSEDVQVYVNYFDITLVPATVFFFNAHHMKMDSGTADHTKWVGAFHRKQDFIDVVELVLDKVRGKRRKCQLFPPGYNPFTAAQFVSLGKSFMAPPRGAYQKLHSRKPRAFQVFKQLGHIQSSHERQADRELPPAPRADNKI
ncbi:hypothetical protein OIU76_020201 [Salix suchowensis]|nr:hypothetical protein OIU76_020201 [Salix suchowensis]